MLLLFGVSAAGFGLASCCAAASLELSRAIADGELDALLAQPKSVLLRAIASRSVASGWGDVASGLLMIALSGTATPAWALLAVMLAALGFVGHGVRGRQRGVLGRRAWTSWRAR